MTELSQEGLERALQSQSQELARILANSRSPSSGVLGGLNQVGSSLIDVGGKVSGVANTLIDVFGKISSGTANHSDVLRATTFILEKFGDKVGGVAANAIKTLGEQVFEVNETMKQTGEYGVTLGGSLGEFNQAVKRGHLTMGEFANLISKNSQEIAGIGGGMDASVRKFAKLLDDVSATDAARDFKAAGMSAEFMAEVAQISTMNQRGLAAGMKDEKKARDEATAAVVYLASEIDLAAQITGKSREQEAAELKKEQQRADMQAAIALKGPEFARNLEQATVGLSESAKRVVGIYATGGPRSKEDVALVASYGQASDKLASLAKSIDSGNLVAIERNKVEAQAAVAARMQDRSFLQGIVSTEGKLFGGEAAKILTQEMASERSIAAKQAEMGIGTTREAAIDQLRLEGERRQKGQTPTGELDPSAAASRTINSFDNLTKVLAATASDGFKKLNDNLGETNKDAIPKFNNLMKELASPEGVLHKFKTVGDQIKEYGKSIELPVTTAEPKKQKYATGTKGVHGEWFHEFDDDGETVQVDGSEAIIPKNQSEAFVRSWLDSNGEKWISNLVTGEDFVAESQAGKELMTQTQQKMNSSLKELGVTGWNPKTDPTLAAENTPEKIAERKNSPERIEELQRIVSKGFTDAQGKFQNAYNPAAVANAQKELDAINDAKKSLAVPEISSRDNIMKSLGLDKSGKAIENAPMTLKEMSEKLGKPIGVGAGQGASIKPAAKPSPYINEESLQLMREKAEEKLKSGDKSGAKIYQDSIARMSETLKTQQAEIAQKRSEIPAADKGKAEPAEAKPQPEQPKTEQAAQKAPEPTSVASMSDLKDQLVQLNTNVRELIAHTDRVVDGIAKQVKVTKGVSGNRI